MLINLRRRVLFRKKQEESLYANEGNAVGPPRLNAEPPECRTRPRPADAEPRRLPVNGKGPAARGWLAWPGFNRTKLYPEERGESLPVVADRKVVRLRSYHFHDVFVKLSLLSLKDNKKAHFRFAESI